MAEIQQSREGVRGVHSTCEGAQDNAPEGRGPALIGLDGGKCEGMPETAKIPVDKVRQLQRKLWVCAKQSRTRRFHALYDRIYRSDVLWRAWMRVRSNGGAAGVDQATLRFIEERGVSQFLEGIQADLKAGRYRPSPVKPRCIPKADRKQRPLGIQSRWFLWSRVVTLKMLAYMGSTSAIRLYTSGLCPTGCRLGPLLFHALLSKRATAYTPERSSAAVPGCCLLPSP